MKILKQIASVHDVHKLQNDLFRFERYCAMNKLGLNVSKCRTITFSRKTNILNHTYYLLGSPVEKVNRIRDLGVTHDHKLLFDEHIESIINRASKALGFIMRTSLNFKNLKTIKILYCAFVRSHLEYASQVWNPNYKIYINRIENIQKKFLRFLDYKAQVCTSGYINRCKRYHFLPLEHRRTISDISYLMSVARGSIDCPDLLAKIQIRTNIKSLRKRPLLSIPLVKTNYRQNAFIMRASSAFNKWCVDCDLDLFCTSTAAAKRRLTKKIFECM